MYICKKFLSIFFILFSLFAITDSIYSYNLDELKIRGLQKRYLMPIKQKVTPENTIIIFDLHEVLFERYKTAIAYNVIKLASKGMWYYMFNPFFWAKAKSLYSKGLIWEQIYKDLVKEYPDLARFEKDFINIVNSHYPVAPMVDILKKLKEKGYKIFLLSNIGEDVYKDHEKKFKEIMNLFDGIYIPTRKNNYLHKPNPEFYKKFIQFLKEKNLDKKQKIFIDDLKENLDAALKFDIAGIHCRSAKCVLNILNKLEIL